MPLTATWVRWADTRDAQDAVPRLVCRLCFKADSTRQLAFPAGGSIYAPGWDGVLVCETGHARRSGHEAQGILPDPATILCAVAWGI